MVFTYSVFGYVRYVLQVVYAHTQENQEGVT
jgi:hypothetical protein